MALNAFRPAIFAADVFVRLRKALVHGAIANREYEGELSVGDRIYLNEISAVSTSDYTEYTDITWSEPEAAVKTLRIDQKKYAAVRLDDVDKKQGKGDLMGSIAGEVAYALADGVDQFLAAKYSEAGNSVTSITGTAGNVLENVSDMAEALDEENVPADDRFFPIPAWYHSYLLQAATGIIGHTGTPKVFDDDMLVRGFVGQLFGLNLLMSNNVYNSSSVYYMMALHKRALAYVGQLVETEMIRDPDQFGTGIRSLYIYGGEMVRPAAAVTCTVTKG